MPNNKSPKIVVGALVFNSSGKILLITQDKWKGKLCVPGGHVEWGEKLEEALIREIKEEVGLSIKEIKLFNVGEYLLDNENAKEKHFIFIDYTCVQDKGKVLLNDEASSYRWVKPEKSLELDLVSNTRKLIKKFISRSS